ncbi:AAA family ATPase [Nocardioides agariphilus]|uniref:AAA family ATPase n=1 Tax=Nocardioides agariphilus TaxID=433664 RepID=A0A930VPI8_9ACTN|nr:AAA family ATPase [Nocardioides agariphilus]MBF4768337.1 AAA family ATPase [Nocardioides agariphilus]
MAKEVKSALASRGITGETAPPKGIDGKQWSLLRYRLTTEAVSDVADEWRARRLGQAIPDFTPLTPDEVAEPSDLPTWRVRGLWSLGSHGTWAGPKKSFKTTLHDCMAIGVASGQRVLDEWEVVDPGPVLIYAGEGSIEWRKRSLQRIAHDLYNVKLGSGDDQAQVHVVPTAYPFNTPEFRLALAENIKAIKPAFVTLDSTYNYHPRGINTADMYDRGPLFAELSALVRDADSETSLLLIDHMRQAASHDLDAIAMAGVGQWADSWILNIPEHTDPEEGLFKIQMSIGSRRWGGRRRLAEVDLGRFDEDDESWTHPMRVEVSAGEWTSKPKGRSDDRIDHAILQVVRDNEWSLTQTALVDKVGGNVARTRDRLNLLVSQRLLAVERRKRPEGKGGREVVRELVGFPDDAHVESATTTPRSRPAKRGRGSAAASRKKGRG